MRWCVLFVVASCGGDKHLEVVVVDRPPIAVDTAFFKRYPDDRLELVLGEHASCGQLLTNEFDGRRPYILVELPRQLLADGREQYGVGDVWFHGPSPGQGTVTLTGGIATGDRADITLDVSSPEAKLSFKGTVTAESCGDEDAHAHDVVKGSHPSTATMTIATKTIAIRSAIIQRDLVELNDYPRTCEVLPFNGARLSRFRGKWTLDGSRVPKPIDSTIQAFDVELGAKGTSGDGPTVQLALSGATKLGDYDVALAGTIEALDCK
jgi:hypothetical protein